jgi:tetratricopeptide (TPR) repeat protein
MSRICQRKFLSPFLVFILLLCRTGSCQETNAELLAPVAPSPSVANDPDQSLRAYLRLQEQLHAALLAVEQARIEASLEAKTNADLLAGRLNTLERALTQRHDEQQQAERNASRAFMTMVMITLGLGLVALILTAILQNHGMNRLAEIAMGVPGGRTVHWPSHESLPTPNGQWFLESGAKTPETDRLVDTIHRLEKQVHDLERAARSSDSGSVAEETTDNRARAHTPSGHAADTVIGLLGKGQSLLHLGQAEKALACFDEAVAKAPDSAEVHLKRGLALEQLLRPDEALAAYDRCLALSRFHPGASLRKAEILTRQERFAEALECYEQALRSEQKR